jgi:hypothetical protein
VELETRVIFLSVKHSTFAFTHAASLSVSG